MAASGRAGRGALVSDGRISEQRRDVVGDQPVQRDAVLDGDRSRAVGSAVKRAVRVVLERGGVKLANRDQPGVKLR